MLTLFDVIKIDKNMENKIKFKFNINHGDKSKPALHSLVNNPKEFEEMNAWRVAGSSNNNLDYYDYVVSFAQYYVLGVKYWVFGGFYKVEYVDYNVSDGIGYKLKLLENGKPLIGRLVVESNDVLGQAYARTYASAKDLGLIVHEILSTRYHGERFPGYYNVCINHNELSSIYNNQLSDWKDALSYVKGIYVITDLSNGKQYVGKACGSSGIWGRWSAYANEVNIAGGNIEFLEIIKEEGTQYIIDNFQYSILEVFGSSSTEEDIALREMHWKIVLSTLKNGYNRN